MNRRYGKFLAWDGNVTSEVRGPQAQSCCLRINGNPISRRQGRVGVIPTLVIVIFHIEAGELGEVDSQGAAAIVDILAIQRLEKVTDKNNT